MALVPRLGSTYVSICRRKETVPSAHVFNGPSAIALNAARTPAHSALSIVRRAQLRSHSDKAFPSASTLMGTDRNHALRWTDVGILA
jgi:hypothetical protein